MILTRYLGEGCQNTLLAKIAHSFCLCGIKNQKLISNKKQARTTEYFRNPCLFFMCIRCRVYTVCRILFSARIHTDVNLSTFMYLFNLFSISAPIFLLLALLDIGLSQHSVAVSSRVKSYTLSVMLSVRNPKVYTKFFNLFS